MHGGRSLADADHPRYVHGLATTAMRSERRLIASLLRAGHETLAATRERGAPRA
jgi:hypothetical protein